MIKIILLLTCLSLSSVASAMFCPRNFNEIYIGDTIQQINQQCGKPDFEKQLQVEDTGPQQWSYNIHPQMKKYMQIRTNSGLYASVKMELTFQEGKVTNITVNNMSLASSNLCGGNVSVGDTIIMVKSACGEPAIVTKSAPINNNAPKPPIVVQYKYNGMPPVVLVFVDGKLTERN